jgi:hypothetical protein
MAGIRRSLSQSHAADRNIPATRASVANQMAERLDEIRRLVQRAIVSHDLIGRPSLARAGSPRRARAGEIWRDHETLRLRMWNRRSFCALYRVRLSGVAKSIAGSQ